MVGVDFKFNFLTSPQYEKVNEWDQYKVNYEYVKPGAQSTRSLSDFPELFREIYEVDKELREADERSEDAEEPKVR